MRKRLYLLAMVALIILAGNAPLGFSQDPRQPTIFEWTFSPWESADIDRESIVTDRPDFTEASATVGLRTTQIEFGYTYSKDSNSTGRTTRHSWGEPLLRIGVLADWFELRAAAFPARLQSNQGAGPTRVSGWEDLYIGCKLGLTPQSGWLPEMCLIPQMTVPTGGSAFTNDRSLAGVNWCYGWDVNDHWAIGASTQFNRSLDDSGEIYTEWAQSITLVRTWTESLSSYTEWFGIFPDGGQTATVQHYFNGGFAYLLSPDVQWDIRAGVGLSEASDDFFVGTGLSIRYR